jgi:microcystin-dependent protein
MRTALLLIIGSLLATNSGKADGAPKLLPFQGRLTNQNGVVVSNGVKVVQFKIYSVPTGGSPVWAGEVHRTTVNGGLVNVMLGAKTPLEGVDFDQQLYLEITVDVSGPEGVPDGAITDADPPMLPRQLILPVIFAKESANSWLLAGRDWSSILVSGNDPETGFIRGNKLQAGSISALQLASNTITDGAIGTAQLAAQLVIDAFVPPGSIIAFGGTNIPNGWLLCDGTALSSLAYPRLFAAISTNWGIGLSWNGSVWLQRTNDFNLPDLRGLLLRGVNGSRTNFIQMGASLVDLDVSARTNGPTGGNTGNAVGSLQEDELKAHTHELRLQYNWGNWSYGGNNWAVTSRELGNGNDHTEPAGGHETRPKNAYVNYIIKY